MKEGFFVCRGIPLHDFKLLDSRFFQRKSSRTIVPCGELPPGTRDIDFWQPDGSPGAHLQPSHPTPKLKMGGDRDPDRCDPARCAGWK
jgi:hypothetical protein